MPKSNPKHKKNQIIYQRRAKYKSGFPKKLFAVIMLSIIGIGSVAGMIYYLNENPIGSNRNALTVEFGDKVSLDYKLWVDFDHNGNVDNLDGDPYDTGSKINMTVELSSGLPDAFMKGIEGMKEGDTNGFVILAGEGYSDVLPPPPGFPDSTKNAKLFFQVTIISVEKGES